MASRNDATGREKQRSRTGCRTCRSRKVKCDETPGGCRNCARLNLPCPNSPAYGNAVHLAVHAAAPDNPLLATQAGLRRSRTYRSCRFCRTSKSRCSGDRPSCVRCRQKYLECSYDGKQAPAWAEAVTAELEAQHSAHLESPDMRDPRSEGEYPKSDSYSPGSSHSGSQEDESGLSWLLSSSLPEKERIVLLAEEYFASIHNLRAFGFIHKPSFMQKLDERSSSQLSEDVLLHVVCAFGAKAYALRSDHEASDDVALAAGNQWAKKAQQLLLANLNNISVDNTMAVVLLHEHNLRIGNYAGSFMLTGVGIRMAQALQINLESSTDILCQYGKRGLSPSSRESRRRLMWSIYVMDAWVGSGVDELTLIRECDIKIQLPCDERNFSFEVPCAVETLEPGTYLPFVSPEAKSTSPADALDLIAHLVRLVTIRKKVLRFVKHLDEARDPWLPESEFAQLQADLRRWHDRLPYSLRFSKTAIYMRKESSQVGGLLMLHLTYHQTFCDLNRIALGNLFKIRPRIEFPPSQEGFLRRVQDQCFEHAVVLSSIFDEAAKHGPDTLADTWLCCVAHDSAKVMVNYVSKGMGSAEKDKSFRRQVTSYLHGNLRALKRMIPMYALAKQLYFAAINMLRAEGFELPSTIENTAPHEPSDPTETDRAASIPGSPCPIQFTPEYILNPLAIFRMARKDIHEKEKHAPERSSSPNPSIQQTAKGSRHTPASPETRGQHHDQDGFLISNGASDAVGNFQLPTSFDDLQTYLPLMLNVNSPFRGTFGEIPGGGDINGFSHSQGFSFPPIQSTESAGDLLNTSTAAFPHVNTQLPAWSS